MNPFMHLLKSAGSQPPIGTWVMSASSIVAEAMGHAGFDWAVLDMEHSPVDLTTLVHLLQGVGTTRMVPVVRVPWNDTVTIKRVLDAGAQTLLVPFVQDAQEASRAVAATHYPPQGVRGMAAMGRASQFGTVANHFTQANKTVGVIVQLETIEAVAQLELIAAVPGVSALFMGPADLSGSMGHVGQLSHPAVMDTMARAAERARAVGKPIGTVGGTPEMVARYRAMGYDFVAIGSDLGLMMQAAKGAVQALRTTSAEHVHTLAAGTRTDGAY
ncbi:MAG: HpcH/HpaI aldolase family protein [Aquabacterium sp.]